MLSTCPSCLNQILHEEGVDQVRCSCGETFCPYFMPEANVTGVAGGGTSTSASLSSLSLMSAGNQEWDKPWTEEKITPESQPDPENSTDYSESEAAFSELRNFAEGLGHETDFSSSSSLPKAVPSAGTEKNSAALEKAGSPSGAVTLNPSSSQAPGASPPKGNCPITSADSLSGFEILAFLTPLSLWCDAINPSEDPLKQAFLELGLRATQLGANGVVAVRWAFTPDGSRILLTGTPVQCRKKE